MNVEELGAQRHRVDVPLPERVPGQRAHVGNVQDRAAAHLVLRAQAEVVDGRHGMFAGKRSYRTRRQQSAPGGLSQSVEGAVVNPRTENGWRIHDRIHAGIALNPVKENSEAAADGGSAPADRVPRETKARSDLDGRRSIKAVRKTVHSPNAHAVARIAHSPTI